MHSHRKREAHRHGGATEHGTINCGGGVDITT